MPLLEIERLDAGYGRLQILFEVSLSVDKGVTLVQGKNGSGKSTLLKAFIGLTEVSGGRILFHNQEITRLKPERIIQRGIGYVPQRRNVFLELSVAENLEMGRLSSRDDSPLSGRDRPSFSRADALLCSKKRRFCREGSGNCWRSPEEFGLSRGC